MNLDDIRKRLAECPIPEDARADWDGTNHYEITSAHSPLGEHWWLDELEWCLRAGSADPEGRKLGAVLDYACAYRRDVAELLRRIDELEGR